MEALEKAEQLKKELDNLRPLDAESEARIMQKFRLDWNYHSNKLEGNSYTYGETKMLLLKGLTAGGKPKKDSEEISGHNEAIDYVINSIKENTPLSEVFIRDLNKFVLVKPHWIEAKTADGQPTKRLIKPGEYKTEPNHVETETGIFYFAEPFETPAKMQELVEWFREKQELQETNPVILAAEFHYRFVRIHPFDDGNGRVARLLMNFILMQFGYPPVIIKNEDKQNYLAILNQADFHILEPFMEYIAQNLVRSLELKIKGAKGKDIEEPEDLDKELALLEKKVRSIGQKIEVTKNRELLVRISENSITPLFVKFLQARQKFDRFYLEKGYVLSANSFKGIENAEIEEIIRRLTENINENTNYIEISYWHTTFNQYDLGDLDFTSRIKIYFGTTDYNLQFGDKMRIVKQYPENLTEEEITKIVKSDNERHKEYIDERTEERRK